MTVDCTSEILHTLAHPWRVFHQFSKWTKKHLKSMLKPKGRLSRSPLWPDMLHTSCLRLAFSEDIAGLSRGDCCFTEHFIGRTLQHYLSFQCSWRPASLGLGTGDEGKKTKILLPTSTARHSVMRPLVTFGCFTLPWYQKLLQCSKILLFHWSLMNRVWLV